MSHSGNFTLRPELNTASVHRKLQKIKDSKKEKVNLENLQIGEEIAQRRPYYISCI